MDKARNMEGGTVSGRGGERDGEGKGECMFVWCSRRREIEGETREVVGRR